MGTRVGYELFRLTGAAENIAHVYGIIEGNDIGVNVGRGLGILVGETVGRLVGNRVGNRVGNLVGNLVGETVGCLVDIAVGRRVGLVTGERVGPTVNMTVGLRDGLAMGIRVGLTMGLLVLGKKGIFVTERRLGLKLDLRTGLLGFVLERLGFVCERLGFVCERLWFVCERLGFDAFLRTGRLVGTVSSVAIIGLFTGLSTGLFTGIDPASSFLITGLRRGRFTFVRIGLLVGTESSDVTIGRGRFTDFLTGRFVLELSSVIVTGRGVLTFGLGLGGTESSIGKLFDGSSVVSEGGFFGILRDGFALDDDFLKFVGRFSEDGNGLQSCELPPTFRFNQSLPLFTTLLAMCLVALFTLPAIVSNIFEQGFGKEPFMEDGLLKRFRLDVFPEGF